MQSTSRPVSGDVNPTGDSQGHRSSLPGFEPKVAEDARFAKRKWRAFKLVVWGLAELGSVFLLIGMFWIGTLGLPVRDR